MSRIALRALPGGCIPPGFIAASSGSVMSSLPSSPARITGHPARSRMLRRLLLACAAITLTAQAPIISFDKTHHDFGRITPDRKVAAKYHVTNTGNAILSITQVRPSCGCTATVMGKWSIAPGESTDLEATFDPRGLKGGVRKSIEVVCNDPKTPAVSLTLEAEVVQEIMPSVDSVYFHHVPKAATSRSTVRYASGNGEPVQI